MASRYNFSVQRRNKLTGHVETFQVIEANSFDEARKEVEKGVHDQELQELAEEQKQEALNASKEAASPSSSSRR